MERLPLVRVEYDGARRDASRGLEVDPACGALTGLKIVGSSGMGAVGKGHGSDSGAVAKLDPESPRRIQRDQPVAVRRRAGVHLD